ncbi:MAG: hypothetical protein AAF611_12335 [Bacteroidota bacterium]
MKNLKGLKQLSKKEQTHVTGGDSFLCVALCGPGDGNIPIYDYPPFGMTHEDVSFPEQVGCFCV